ncbi:hypothetical protein A1D22_05775 [Pasteurellaceae bacterium LFhippo2]|nr:hypothetical protein [Pasteurellaceae bacterium LFhippo2]
MAVYHLARGGFAPEFGTNACVGKCSNQCAVDEHGLPFFLQPDLRSDGGYGFRDKVEWKQLMNQLDVRYGKTAEDLEVGDKLYIFLQPNHSNVKSLFVDFREPVAGFKFTLGSINGADYSGTEKLVTYTEKLQVENVEDTSDLDTGAVEERTQWVTLVENGYNAKVDAVVLEIVALPTGGLPKDMALLFARRFEQDGYMM